MYVTAGSSAGQPLITTRFRSGLWALHGIDDEPVDSRRGERFREGRRRRGRRKKSFEQRLRSWRGRAPAVRTPLKAVFIVVTWIWSQGRIKWYPDRNFISRCERIQVMTLWQRFNKKKRNVAFRRLYSIVSRSAVCIRKVTALPFVQRDSSGESRSLCRRIIIVCKCAYFFMDKYRSQLMNSFNEKRLSSEAMVLYRKLFASFIKLK